MLRLAMIKNLFLATLSLTTIASPAWAGKTADGCTYQIVNGQYLTSCGNKGAPAGQGLVASNAPAAPAPTSYGSVPMRYEPSAPRPSVQNIAPQQPDTMNVPINTPMQGQMYEREDADLGRWERKRAKEHIESLDSTYAGVQLGSTAISQSNAGSTLGLGVNVGTNIDNTFGVELGYSYASQDLNLHLDNRNQADPSQTSTAVPRSTDAMLKSHLISGEIQGHLTDSYKRLRPYLGLGLAWKNSSVEENTVPNSYGSSTGGGTLSQNTLGGIGSAGTKFRISQAINLGVTLKYFFPISRGNSRLEQPQASPYAYGIPATANQTKLTKADDALTGSSQYQILGGLQYVF